MSHRNHGNHRNYFVTQIAQITQILFTVTQKSQKSQKGFSDGIFFHLLESSCKRACRIILSIEKSYSLCKMNKGLNVIPSGFIRSIRLIRVRIKQLFVHVTQKSRKSQKYLVTQIAQITLILFTVTQKSRKSRKLFCHTDRTDHTDFVFISRRPEGAARAESCHT